LNQDYTEEDEKFGTHMLDFKLLNSQAFLNGDLIFRAFLRNALKISSSFLKESILFILNLDYAEEDE
jgi:hypothetical protein